jgi:hypothetical protein
MLYGRVSTFGSLTPIATSSGWVPLSHHSNVHDSAFYLKPSRRKSHGQIFSVRAFASYGLSWLHSESRLLVSAPTQRRQISPQEVSSEKESCLTLVLSDVHENLHFRFSCFTPLPRHLGLLCIPPPRTSKASTSIVLAHYKMLRYVARLCIQTSAEARQLSRQRTLS